MNKYVKLGTEKDDGVSVPEVEDTEEYVLIYNPPKAYEE